MEMDAGWTRELLYQLVDSVTEYAIFAADTDGRVVTWNPGGENLFGYGPDEIIGQLSATLFVPEDREADVPEQEMATARETGSATDERWHLKKDGSRFFASGIQTALRDDKGKLTGYVKIARDLSERINLQSKVTAAYDLVDQKVSERTSELSNANVELQVEVTDRRQNEELRVALLRKLVATQEGERKRISRDIHDHIGQRMTALKLKLNLLTLTDQLDPQVKEKVLEVQNIADMIDAEVDFLAWELRPSVLDDLGLPAAVDKFVREWAEHFQTRARSTSIGIDGRRFPPEIEINLYRIAQEALNNVAKHASARDASVLLEKRNDAIRLIIEDDGVGFSPEIINQSNGNEWAMGLLGMKERAELFGGSFEIESAPGKGTTVFVRMPVPHNGADQNGS